MKKVQVLLSTYNGEKYLREQLESLLKQGNVDLKILIRDDGSKDHTIDIIDEFIDKNSNIQLIRGKNIGVVRSFFELIELADEEIDYYAFCDQDDYWKDDKLLIAVNRLEDEKEVLMPLLYCSKTITTDQNLNIKSASSIPKKPLKIENAVVENIATGCTVVFNKSCKETIVSKKVDFNNILMHDWWLYMVSLVLGKVIYDTESFIYYRQHASNVVGGNISLLNSYKKKFKRFLSSESKGLLVLQAKELLKLYETEIGNNDRLFLEKFVKNRSAFFAKLNFAFLGGAYRQSTLDNIFLKLLILIGRI